MYTNLFDSRLHLRASTYIEIGEEICNQYSKPLINTLERRYNLNNRWHFNCMCLRCEDPYELGSNLSSLNCPLRRSSQKNCSGSMVSDMPLNSQSDWACDECGTKRPWSYIMDSLNSAQKVLKSMARDLDIISHYERYNIIEAYLGGAFTNNVSTIRWRRRRKGLKISKIC